MHRYNNIESTDHTLIGKISQATVSWFWRTSCPELIPTILGAEAGGGLPIWKYSEGLPTILADALNRGSVFSSRSIRWMIGAIGTTLRAIIDLAYLRRPALELLPTLGTSHNLSATYLVTTEGGIAISRTKQLIGIALISITLTALEFLTTLLAYCHGIFSWLYNVSVFSIIYQKHGTVKCT